VDKNSDKAISKAESPPRFDFYKILPGSEETVTDRQLKEPLPKTSTPTAKETFFLQAGSFQNPVDADNLKARLALLGVEANIETTTLPDKGVWHRLRVGPHATVADLNRVRDNLKQNGIETTAIRVRVPSEPANK
jgi:cell division protein FtsN